MFSTNHGKEMNFTT